MSPSKPSSVSVLVCAVCLILTRASVLVFGFARTEHFLKRASGALLDCAPSGIDRDRAMAVVRNVIRAAVYVPTRAVCLEQSLVIWFLLRRRGFNASVRIGVQPLPFAAHAWVELNGMPLDQHEDFVRNYSILATHD